MFIQNILKWMSLKCWNFLYVEFNGQIIQQTVGIPMDTNCAPLLADLFLFGYKGGVYTGALKSSEEKPCSEIQFHLQLYIDGVLSLNNSKISEFKVVICAKYINLNKITKI